MKPPTSVQTEIPSAAAKSPTAAHHGTGFSQFPPARRGHQTFGDFGP